MRPQSAETNPFAVIHRDDVVQGAIELTQRWDEFPQTVINFGGPEVLARTEFSQTLKEVALPTLRFRVTEPDAEFFKNRPRVFRKSIYRGILADPTYPVEPASFGAVRSLSGWSTIGFDDSGQVENFRVNIHFFSGEHFT